MTSVETNLETIKRLSIEREEENVRFRIFLKGRDSNRIDSAVHRINADVVKEIDCATCGNCCNTLRPAVSDGDVSRLSEIMNCTKQSFMNEHTKLDALDRSRTQPIALRVLTR